MDYNNGLQSFLFFESASNQEAIKNFNAAFQQKASRMATGTSIKPEDAAKFYLEKTFEHKQGNLSTFNKPQVNADFILAFEAYQVEDNPFTLNKTIRLRQKINNISVYGSNVNVEIDRNQKLVSINSSIAPVVHVNTVAKVSPANALKTASAYIKNTIPSNIIPLMYIYFHNKKWKLVYIIKNVISKKKYTEDEEADNNVNYINIIVDARSGKVLKETARSFDLQVQATGDDGEQYTVTVRENGAALELADNDLDVITYDLNFDSYIIDGRLPGTLISKNGNDWLSPGINAHHNTCRVAEFLKDILKRNSVDDKGMSLVSTVRCVSGLGIKGWENARWYSKTNQMVYGQSEVNNVFKTLAIALDIVAHEIFHGVTDYTCKLDYENQSGALNESYSDIFGIIVLNFNEPTIDSWKWEIGKGIKNVSFRDLSKPENCGQPSHMSNYKNLPNDRVNDHGGVHLNSGIHNKAAYNLISSKDGNNQYIFVKDELAVLFYQALIQLSNRSGFSDSYRSILNAANSLFNADANKEQKMNAIKNAFESVGILDS